MLLPLPVTDPGILPRCYCRVLARWDTLYQGVRVWSQLLLDHMECHKIIGREKYYERLSFIDAIWKVGHVIIYFPKLKGGHKTNLPFKYDWTSIFKVFDFWNHPFLSEILLSCMHATSSLTSIKHHRDNFYSFVIKSPLISGDILIFLIVKNAGNRRQSYTMWQC